MPKLEQVRNVYGQRVDAEKGKELKRDTGKEKERDTEREGQSEKEKQYVLFLEAFDRVRNISSYE